MNSIIPTIGRKVWFYDTVADKANSAAVPFDATVIYVWGPTCVNLRVTTHSGETQIRTSVTLRDPAEGDCHGKEYVCTWMPYQVGQAKAAESKA